jgi:hypothetical protein
MAKICCNYLRADRRQEESVTESEQLKQNSAAHPSIRFYHSDDLRARTLALLATLEQPRDDPRHRDALTNLVLELLDAGTDYYFLRPLKLAQAGFVAEQTARLGLDSVRRAMSPVIRSIIGRLDKRQLIVVCGHIRQLTE